MQKCYIEHLITDARQVIFIDEIHKDSQASRRRKGWGARNSVCVVINRRFNNELIHAMVDAFDIYVFIPSTVDCVQRNEISTEGTAGKVEFYLRLNSHGL